MKKVIFYKIIKRVFNFLIIFYFNIFLTDSPYFSHLQRFYFYNIYLNVLRLFMIYSINFLLDV